MIKTAIELRKFFEDMQIPKIGNIVAVLDTKSKRYEKATVVAEVPTSEYKLAQYKLSRKINGERSFVTCDISAIHAGNLVGRLAR